MVAEEKVPAVPLPLHFVWKFRRISPRRFRSQCGNGERQGIPNGTSQNCRTDFESISLHGTIFDRAEIAGPRLSELFLEPEWFSKVVKPSTTEKDTYGKTQTGAGKRALVEFVSANPTGPMHVGNARERCVGRQPGGDSQLDWLGGRA